MRACVVFNVILARKVKAAPPTGSGFVAAGGRATGAFRTTVHFEEFHVSHQFLAGNGCGSWFET